MAKLFHLGDTIVALATAREPGYAQGIVRMSGPESARILDRVFKSQADSAITVPSGTQVLRGELACEQLETHLPCKVLLWPDASSYTNQVSAEIHTIGSLPILEIILDQLCQEGARLAEPGEFTLRAFLSGRLDLTAAEAVLGVIDAEDQTQLKTALEQLSGGLEKPLLGIRDQLMESVAHLEAGLDFVEEDIEFISASQMRQMLEESIQQIEYLQQQIGLRGDVQNNLSVVLYGEPNVGKSSLFNALIEEFDGTPHSANTESIVSSIAGTTRDYLTANIRVGGFECTLVDTAGVDCPKQKDQGVVVGNQGRSLADGQSKSEQLKNRSSLQLYCVDASRPFSLWEKQQLQLDAENRLICLTKCDQAVRNTSAGDLLDAEYISTSAAERFGLDSLGNAIAHRLGTSASQESVAGTAIRCSSLVRNAITALRRAVDLVDDAGGDELVAVEVRIALDEIGKITGTIYTDDILDVVFGKFCVGK